MRACSCTPTRRIPALRSALSLLFLLAAGLLLFGGCSDATAPAKPTNNTLDPGAGTFALKDVTVPGPGGTPMLLRLEGSDLVTDPATGTVSLSVQVRNLSGQAVTAPLIVWLSDLQPADVVPVNADLTLPPANTDPVVAPGDSSAFGFDYTALLEGGRLPDGEATAARTWTFSDPTLGAFAFAARIECGAFAGQARLGGRCFVDLDGNGRPDPGEPPFTMGGVQVTGPDGLVSWASPSPDGHWEVPVALTGLYEAYFMSLDMGPRALALTTPNPLNIVITAGPDGQPRNWLDADFGVARDALPPPGNGEIQFTDLRPQDLHVAPWTFLGALPLGADLNLQVGYSGCQPEHAFSLWMSGGFLESMPPRAHVTLVHETEEACDMAFTDGLQFDLRPLFRMYAGQYGAGPLILILHGPDGFTQEVPVFVAAPDSIGPPGNRPAG